jgi:aldose 1-epimerase
VEYSLGINNGPNHLHGGHRGFDKCVWEWSTEELGGSGGEAAVAVRFTLRSPDGDEGYPGALEAVVTYTLTSRGELVMDYRATADKSTPVNLTNHAYWNLSGAHRCGAGDHFLQMHCSRYVVTGDGNIPTGELRDVAGSAFDLRGEGGAQLGDRIPLIPGPGDITGYDHCFVVDGAYERNMSGGHNAEEGLQLFPAAVLYCPLSGRALHVSTSQPGIQVYTANFLAGTAPFTRHNAVCLETQHFPDSINQPHFPSCVLRPGQSYHHQSKFAFSVVA